MANLSRALLLLLVLSVALNGCGQRREAARLELAQMNIPFTERAFLQTAWTGNAPAVELFLAAGMNPEARTFEGQTALMLATLSSRTDTVKTLLAKGADVNARDKFLGTALMTAAGKGEAEIVRALVAKGADVNAQVLVEAADTGPFFHNNSIATIEGAVAFYNSAAFNNAPGFGAVVGGIQLEPTEVEAVAAFLRVINALENIRSSDDLDSRAKLARTTAQTRELITLSIAEVEDAIEDLRGAGLHPATQERLGRVLALYDAVLVTPLLKNVLINQALALKARARSDLKF